MAILSLIEEKSLWKRLYGNFSIADNGCWNWTGSVSKNGYPYLHLKRKGYKPRTLGAYRALYVLIFGMPEDGLHIDHLCRNTKCVNPEHLEPVTSLVNTMRSPIAIASINAHKTECLNGHKFTKENTYRPPKRQKSRYCITCMRDRQREYQK